MPVVGCDERPGLGDDARVFEVRGERPVRRGQPLVVERRDREVLAHRSLWSAPDQCRAHVPGLALDTPHRSVEPVERGDPPVEAGRRFDREQLDVGLFGEPGAQVDEGAEGAEAAGGLGAPAADAAVVEQRTVGGAGQRGCDHDAGEQRDATDERGRVDERRLGAQAPPAGPRPVLLEQGLVLEHQEDERDERVPDRRRGAQLGGAERRREHEQQQRRHDGGERGFGPERERVGGRRHERGEHHAEEEDAVGDGTGARPVRNTSQPSDRRWASASIVPEPGNP